MITRIIKKNKIKSKNSFVEPDEIFLDSKNLQNFFFGNEKNFSFF